MLGAPVCQVRACTACKSAARVIPLCRSALLERTQPGVYLRSKRASSRMKRAAHCSSVAVSLAAGARSCKHAHQQAGRRASRHSRPPSLCLLIHVRHYPRSAATGQQAEAATIAAQRAAAQEQATHAAARAAEDSAHALSLELQQLKQHLEEARAELERGAAAQAALEQQLVSVQVGAGGSGVAGCAIRGTAAG